MIREGEQFSIHTRKKTKGSIFYVQFKLEGGKWSTAKSTGIVDRGLARDRQAAIAWAQKYLDSGQIVSKERMTFGAYAEHFFDWSGDWAKEKRLRGRRVSEEQAKKHGEAVANHLAPYFGPMRLAAVDDEDIRKWQRDMSDRDYAGATINRATVALRLVLKGAYREKLLRRMPVVEAVAEHQRSRGTYTPAEIRALFKRTWPDLRAMIAAKVAFTTGLRAGEITALRRSCVHPEYLDVLHSWNPRYGLGPTKSGKPRIVPIPDLVYSDLVGLLEANPYPTEPDPFLFFDLRDPGKPMDQAVVTEALKVELARIGISEEKRRERNLDLHAARHTFNTLLIDRRVPIQTVQAVTGHLTPEMSQHYYHVAPEALGGIREIAEEMLSEKKKGPADRENQTP